MPRLDPDARATLRARRALFAIATIATVFFFVVYAFAVRSRWGQRLDATALKGRQVLSAHDLHVATRLHTSLDIASLTLLGGSIILVALVRGRPRLAFGAATIIVGSVATSEFLKHTFERPDLGVVDALNRIPSFPSGHTTVAMALSVSAIFVTPRRWRAPVAILGVLFASAIAGSLVATASHRPSDTIGGAFVVTAWSAIVAALLLRSDPDGTPEHPPFLSLSPWMALGGVALLGGSFAVAAISIAAAHYGHLHTVHLGRAFVAAGAAITGTILVCTAALLIAMQTSDLDPSRRAGVPRR